jgi:hypothetical protein
MRVGRIETVVPDRDILVARLNAAEDLDAVKAVVAELIETVGTYAFGINERTGERILGQFALAGGGNVFFTNTDHQGVALRREANLEPVHPQRDRTAQSVEKRNERARAERVTVGKKQ